MWRVTFICPDCNSKHSLNMNLEEMGISLYNILVQGSKSVLIEDLTTAEINDMNDLENVVQLADTLIKSVNKPNKHFQP